MKANKEGAQKVKIIETPSGRVPVAHPCDYSAQMDRQRELYSESQERADLPVGRNGAAGAGVFPRGSVWVTLESGAY